MSATANIRLDIWLDVACLFKTRSAATTACKGGKVHVNGTRAKAHRNIHVGDELEITYAAGRKKIVGILELEERHVPKARARELYEDRTPPPTEAELERRRVDRIAREAGPIYDKGTPSKRDRRKIRKAKEDW